MVQQRTLSKKSVLSKAKSLVFLAIFGLIIAIILFIGLVIYYSSTLPDPSVISSQKISESTKIYDATGTNILYDVHGEEKRTIVPWDQMPDAIKKATLAAEDNQFYTHSGIDLKSIVRAFYIDITNLQASQGGSTITQQLIKNALLSNDKTLTRKLKEAILSIQIESRFTKDQIFWMYLNQIPYGSNVYGIEAASQTFLGKSAKDIDIAEAALLASLPKAPTYYSPNGAHVTELLTRRNYILKSMKDLGSITQNEYDTAIKEVPKIAPKQENISAPHFVIMVKDYLVKKYGEDMVENGGLRVITSLDSNLQKIAEDVVTKYGDINAKKYKATNAALVASDPRTGAILAMVGSRDYFDVKNDGNFNVALASRQPGSSFKPFAYAAAFEKGFPDSTVLFDLKTEFNPLCDPSGNQDKDANGQKCYHPQNYSLTFSGPVTAREAIQRSLNVPSVEMLYLAGINNTIAFAKKLGITTLDNPTSYGLSLVLGGAEVKLTDIVQAYGVFANDGVRAEPTFIQKVTSSDGTVLEEHEAKDERVIDSQVARLITDVLSDNNARGPVFGYNSSLYFPDRPVAAKTGTTQDNRDGWVIGYTPSLATGVWTGNNNNTPMTQAGAGLSAAGPMWHEFMARALANQPVDYFTKPDPVSQTRTMLNGDYRGPDGIHSILYYFNAQDPNSNQPSNPSFDPQYRNWEDAVQKWIIQTGQISQPWPSPLISPSSSPSPSIQIL